VISSQLDPPLGGDNHALLEAARAIRDSGHAHVVDINDNPRARARMSGLMASVAIERFAGIETIPHLTPRDSTITGLESQLLGAHAEGVRNILAVTGDPPEEADYPGARGVYEVDAIGLTELLAHLNHGEDFRGRAIDAPTQFFIGVAVNPTADNLDVELDRFARKVEAGAQFAMTQVLFDIAYLDAFLERLGGDSPIPLLVGVWALPSLQLAQRIHNEVPGIVVPEHVQHALRDAGSDAGRVGAEVAQNVIEASRTRARGIYVVAPFRSPERALELFR
jgi:homocysteine S-methyltransferase